MMAGQYGDSKWIAARIVEVFTDGDGQFYWHRKLRRGGRIVADGGEGYTSQGKALAAALRENPGIAVVTVV